MKGFTYIPPDHAGLEGRFDDMSFVFIGYGRKPDMLPGFLFEDVSHEIVFMQALHNNNDAALLLVMQSAVQSDEASVSWRMWVPRTS